MQEFCAKFRSEASKADLSLSLCLVRRCRKARCGQVLQKALADAAENLQIEAALVEPKDGRGHVAPSGCTEHSSGCCVVPPSGCHACVTCVADVWLMSGSYDADIASKVPV